MKNKLTIILISLLFISILLNIFFKDSNEEKIIIITENGTEIVNENNKKLSNTESATLFVSSVTGTTAILQLILTFLKFDKCSSEKRKNTKNE